VLLRFAVFYILPSGYVINNYAALRFAITVMIKEQYKYSELTARIIGCAMEVHAVLGNGFQEVIYQRAQHEFKPT